MEFEETRKQEVFLRLYEPARDKLWRYIRSLVWVRDDAKDVESETVMQAYINLHKLRDESTFLYFLFGIASRILKQKARKCRLRAAFQLGKKEEHEFHDPAHNLDVEILYKAIRKLPARERETIVLFEISGLSIKEIHELQGAGIPAIKTRLSRARSRLKALLNEEGRKYTNASTEDVTDELRFTPAILKQEL